MIRERILSRANRGASQGRSRDRMAEKGAVDINRVDQALYRPDLGFKLTNTGYDKLKIEDVEFGSKYSETLKSNQSAIQQNQGIVSSIDAYLESTKGITPESLYKQAQKEFVPVHVVDGKAFDLGTSVSYDSDAQAADQEQALREAMVDRESSMWQGKFDHYKPTEDRIQYTMYLPKEVVVQLDSQFNKKGSYSGMKYSDGYYIGDSPIGAGGDRYGKELRDALVGVEQQVQSAFYSGIAPKIQEMTQEVSRVQGEKSKVLDYISTSEGNIQEANQQKQLRDTTKDAYKNQYESSVSQRQALFRPWV